MSDAKPLLLTPDEIGRRLRSSRLLRGVKDGLVDELAAGTRQVRLGAGELVWRAGEEPDHVGVIQRGLVWIVRRSPSPGVGESTLGLFGPREAIGVAAALEGSPYPADAIAAGDDVELLLVPSARLRDAASLDMGLAQAMNRALLDHTRALQAKIEVLTAGPVAARLAALLLHLADRFGDELEGGLTVLPLRLGRSDLARLVGARVETVIRVMSRWQKLGWLRTTDDGLEIVELARIQRMAGL
jgi:CRP-like cAMP-binding protein